MASVRRLMLVGATLALTACGRGLPPEPPDHDAADPEAALPRATPGPGPLDRSAFSDAALRGEGEDAGPMHHGHHGHHGHAASTATAAAEHEGHAKPADAEPRGDEGHEGHTPAKKAAGEEHAHHGAAEAKHHAP